MKQADSHSNSLAFEFLTQSFYCQSSAPILTPDVLLALQQLSKAAQPQQAKLFKHLSQSSPQFIGTWLDFFAQAGLRVDTSNPIIHYPHPSYASYFMDAYVKDSLSGTYHQHWKPFIIPILKQLVIMGAPLDQHQHNLIPMTLSALEHKDSEAVLLLRALKDAGADFSSLTHEPVPRSLLGIALQKINHWKTVACLASSGGSIPVALDQKLLSSALSRLFSAPPDGDLNTVEKMKVALALTEAFGLKPAQFRTKSGATLAQLSLESAIFLNYDTAISLLVEHGVSFKGIREECLINKLLRLKDPPQQNPLQYGLQSLSELRHLGAKPASDGHHLKLAKACLPHSYSSHRFLKDPAYVSSLIRFFGGVYAQMDSTHQRELRQTLSPLQDHPEWISALESVELEQVRTAPVAVRTLRAL